MLLLDWLDADDVRLELLVMLLELWLLVRLELDELFSLDVLVELCELELPELGLLLGLDWLD